MTNFDHLLADSRIHKAMLGFGVVALALVAVWTTAPSTTLAETGVDRTAGPIGLGTLHGQALSIRVVPGPFGPGYEVLDNTGSLVGTFENEYQLIAAFSVPAPSRQIADVPTIDEMD
ncbi:MAG: hypothetical protein OSA40_00965 [Phycisphaerales bacterium]|nr:hypothetical protein [Phycisphaerales bacterium]